MQFASVIHQSPFTTARVTQPYTLLTLSLLTPYTHYIYILLYIAFFFISMKLFSKLHVYTLATMSNSMYMDNLLKNSYGGGYKPAPDVIKIRVRLFAEKRFYRSLSRLRPDQRTVIAYTLSQQFEFSNADIAALLSVSSSTVIRDLRVAQLQAKTQSRFLTEVGNVEDYILYNAKYIH